MNPFRRKFYPGRFLFGKWEPVQIPWYDLLTGSALLCWEVDKKAGFKSLADCHHECNKRNLLLPRKETAHG
ncbi:hypothetical protein [Alcaligenes faecalis]|uniref:hypothetical protein n=1 Tax=Alcaligenes faecalis TaxID=511 RepID=UPI00214FC3B1|nr:hypothetical protein [Alcaligenes faecalis]MCR4146616.1 hypothetical protein [Alcaligenes faecalis]